MPLCRINIGRNGLSRHGETRDRLLGALADRASGAPVILLIHGYKFSPSIEAHDPHGHIFSLEPKDCWKAVSWPRQLGLGAGKDNEPLCLAVGWEARGSLWQAYGAASEAGKCVADLIAVLRELEPGLSVSVVAHSLGARVALSSLPHLPRGAIGKAVLLAAAEVQSATSQWLDCAAGEGIEVLNVTSRENDPFDCLLEWLVAPLRRNERALGRGTALRSDRWLDMRIDDDETRHALASMGHYVPSADRGVCHWSVYLRGGLFPLYRDVLCGNLTLHELRDRVPDARLGTVAHLSPLTELTRAWLAGRLAEGGVGARKQEATVARHRTPAGALPVATARAVPSRTERMHLPFGLREAS